MSGYTFVTWCSGCSAEPAIDQIQVEINDEWVDLPIGAGCLTKLMDENRLEE